jgi:hypothetical protein
MELPTGIPALPDRARCLTSDNDPNETGDDVIGGGYSEFSLTASYGNGYTASGLGLTDQFYFDPATSGIGYEVYRSDFIQETAVPIPAPLILFGSGLISLFVIRRKR